MTSLTTDKDTFVEVQTPSGIEIRYHWEPERKYEIRKDIGDASSKLDATWHEVPSVTTVLDVLEKGGLKWWGMEVGVQGVLELQHYPDVSWDTLKEAEPAGVVKMLSKHGLDVNKKRDAAAKRGHSVHAALEGWAKEGVIPDPSIFPHEERGYVEGLVKFLMALEGACISPECEVMVASIEYGYAGRYDLSVLVEKPVEVAYRWTPVRGPKLATLQPGRYMIDLKTSKYVYTSHHRQLAGYELASRECGYEPTDAQGILHVMDNGGYEFVRSVAEADDFLVTLRQFQSEQHLKERSKKK